MSGIVLVIPVLAGKSEYWRRISQEILELHRAEYETSRKALEITREMAWITPTPRGEVLLLYLESPEPDRTLSALAQSEQTFDCWFRQQLREVCGQDSNRIFPGWPAELLYGWQNMPEETGFLTFQSTLQTERKIVMSLEANKELARRLYQAMNEADMAAVDQLLSPDFVNHDPGLPPLPPGPESFKQVIGMIHNGFPDGKFEIQDIVAEGDLVAVRWIISGTHQGEFAGVPPTGKHISVGGSVLQRIENGKSAEHWALWDVLGMLTQMGAIPAGSEQAS
ncbi:MAG TPA: ester cyclase [Chloroflexia bacterium]|nr:ester cyclase [Chloroflexia bacterium]